MNKDKIFIGLVVVDAILLVLNICDSVFGSMIRALFSLYTSDAASIAIIGGADGPTAVFITGRFSWEILLLCAVLIVAVILFIKKQK